MRPVFFALAALSGAACSAQISNGGGRGGQLDGVDAGSTGDPTADAMPPPTTPSCTSRAVYLNFEGQTLTQGPSDATTNHAGWMTIASGTAPPYLSGNAGRAAAIEAITDGVRMQLSQFPVTVVTTRPASGNYVMIVFGGLRTAVGSNYGGGVNQLDCGDVRPNDVAWISDTVTPKQHVINTAIGAIGFGLGLTATSDPLDCMCGWANGCVSDNTVACKLGSPIARDSTATQTCPSAAARQDEVAAIHDAFCM
jgi:hypothetical protein